MWSSFIRRSVPVFAAAALALTGATLTAQGDRFEKTVPFEVDQSHTLGGTVGPVSVSTLKITNLGRGYGRGGFGPRMGSNSELSTTLRLAFDVDNPRDDDWEVTFTVELLDRQGKVIDRSARKENFEDEAKVFNFDHPLLEYVLPAVTAVKVTLQGRRD
jgi:hypothetical protein